MRWLTLEGKVFVMEDKNLGKDKEVFRKSRDSQKPLDLLEELKSNKSSEQKKERLHPVRIRLRFEPHMIEDFSQYTTTCQRLIHEMKQVFEPGQKNIYFAEDDSGAAEVIDDIYQRGLTTYGSHVKAFAYLQFVINNNYEPSAFEVERFLNYMYSPSATRSLDPKVVPLYLYSLAIYESLDALTAEGYKIDFAREKITNQDLIFQYREQFSSLEDFRRYYEALTSIARERDRLVVDQLNTILEEAKQNNTPVNVFVLRGKGHGKFLTTLSERLQVPIAVSQSSPQRKTVSAINEILDLLMIGKSPSESLWHEAYEEYKSHQLRKPVP